MYKIKEFRQSLALTLISPLLISCGLTAEDWAAISQGLEQASRQQAALYEQSHVLSVGYYSTVPSFSSVTGNYNYYPDNSLRSSHQDYYPLSSGYSSYGTEVKTCTFSCGQVHNSCFSAANSLSNHGNDTAADEIHHCRANLHYCEQSCR